MHSLELVVSQLRRATRSLRRRRALTAVAVLTLALGIGASAAIFSIIDAVLLEPLPFRDAERLVMVWSTSPDQGLAEGAASYPDFDDWRTRSKAFDGMAAVWTFPNGDVNLTGGAEPQRVSVARITPDFFSVLGVAPLHGRGFLPEESVVGNHRRAILSYGLWRRAFGADPGIVGRPVMVNGFPYTVVGVMPRELQARSVKVLGTDVQLWRPLTPNDNQTGGRDARKLRVVGRLAAGVTPRRAEEELGAVAARLAEAYPESNRGQGVRLVPLREQVVRDVRRGLFLLLAAVAVVLVGACANVANLLLIRAAANRRPRAMEHALGASPLRLAGQALAESALLGAAGALGGVLLAHGVVTMVAAYGPADIPLLADVRVNGTVLAFTLAATALTVLLVGLLPAWRSARPRLGDALRQAGGGVHGREDRRLMGALTVSQIALATVLLIASGLLLRSFRALMRVDSGVRAERVLTFQVEIPMGGGMPYEKQPARDVFYATLLERLAGLPGVSGATMASAPPLEEEPSSFTFRWVGAADARDLRATRQLVAPDYFSLLGIPVTRGRPLAATDDRSAPPVAVVSEALARAAWGGADPVGQRIVTPAGDSMRVVGVVGDVRTTGLDGEAARIVYVPTGQGSFNFMTLLVRTRGDPGALVPAVRGVVRALDAGVPLHHVRTVDELVAVSVAPQRFQMLLVSAFAAVAFVLAVLGVYGVTAYGVSERTGELGIRAALGATGGDIRRLVLREGGRLALVGIAVGGIVAAALSGVMSRFVFHVRALDPVTFAVVPILLALAAFVATLMPANRAARSDPARALRAD